MKGTLKFRKAIVSGDATPSSFGSTAPFKYSTIDAPMRVIINALVDKDYSEVTNWDDIYLEFCECIGGKKLVRQLNDVEASLLLRNKILLAQNLIVLYETTGKELWFDALKDLNYHLRIPKPDLDDFDKYCEQIEGWIKLDVSNLMEMEHEQEQKLKHQHQAPTQSYTRNYFADMFIELMDVFKVPINDSISGREYGRWIVKYEQHREHINSLNHK